MRAVSRVCLGAGFEGGSRFSRGEGEMTATTAALLLAAKTYALPTRATT